MTPSQQVLDTIIHHRLREHFSSLRLRYQVNERPTPLRQLYRHAVLPGSQPTFEEDSCSNSSTDSDTMPDLVEATVPFQWFSFYGLPRQELLPEMVYRATPASPTPQMKEHGEELF